MSEIEITQADREAAANFYGKYLARPGEVPVEAAFRVGHVDESPLIQAFARHRHEARAEALEEAAAMIDKFGDRHERDIAAGLKGAGKRTAHLDACRNIATAIRALRSGEREG